MDGGHGETAGVEPAERDATALRAEIAATIVVTSGPLRCRADCDAGRPGGSASAARLDVGDDHLDPACAPGLDLILRGGLVGDDPE